MRGWFYVSACVRGVFFLFFFMVAATHSLNDEMTFSSTVMVWLSWRGRTCGTVCFPVNIDSVNIFLLPG